MSMNGAAPDDASAAEQAKRDQVSMQLLDAISVLTQKASMAQDTREAAEASKAVLAFAQALVILDPTVISPQGVPPETLAKSAAQRPAESAKRKAINVSSQPDGSKRYEMEG
jgi:hypothetical protein